MEGAKQLHARLLRRGTRRLQPLLLRVLAAGDLRYAALLLESYPSSSPPSALLHNRLLHALASLRHPLLLPFFSRAHRLRLLTPLSFTLLFSSSAASSFSVPFAVSSHGLLIKSGNFASGGDPFLASALVSFYAKNRLLHDARRVFDEMPRRDAAVYNALLSAYTRGGLIDAAEKLFEEMPEKNVVSWTAMVSGYAQNGRHEQAVETFLEMWERAEVQPNELTVSSVLPACAAVGAMDLGRKVEKYAKSKGLLENLFVANALVEMYAKCGSIQQAWEVFQGIGLRRDLCSWNSMIMAFAVHGLWREALGLFHKLRMTGIKPDGITFVGVILACTHGGLVDEGKLLFNSMRAEFGLNPRIEHYGCMVDLLGRAGLLKEADSLIASMPVEPDAVIWGALLGACSFHGNVELAEIAVDKLMCLEPENTANLVILSNIYASCGKWDGVARVWKLLKEKDHKKSAGSSFIELDGRMHKFLVEDKSHPRFEEVYKTLDSVTLTMKLANLENPDEVEVEG
ncbi:pentatricopeptide repeat-containing protein At5g08510-like [Phragmites australis]|uniref:pentatricopeptide repeat-containing protein At5g08510-like n=1 Tax=Phragmites australis TaxID=29695 RepID=UPI002D77A0CE|nr:pentatricopeptide repeat-containing protein At5g08510-like [Phragmites australis]